MSKNRTACASFILLAFAVISFSATEAANSDIPDGYESQYHRLLEQKQRCLDDRADLLRTLPKVDSWIQQIDRALKTPPVLSRQKLLASRANLQSLRTQYYKDIASQDQQLLNIEKDLAYLEAEMKHFACLK